MRRLAAKLVEPDLYFLLDLKGQYYYRSEIIFEDANTPGYLENYPTLLERLAQRIVHEIAHFVGLKHGEPFMDPNDSRYTTEDTRMSYNYDAVI